MQDPFRAPRRQGQRHGVDSHSDVRVPRQLARLLDGEEGAVRFRYGLQDLFGDVSGAVVSTIIVLPWALAYGVASGLGPLAGLYCTITIGFFAAVFGGTRAQMSDPSAPMLVAMTVILMEYAGNPNVMEHVSGPNRAFTIVMLAGLLQVAFGALGIGRFVVYTPYSVISGFMSGIGVVIMVISVLPLLGTDFETGGPLDVIHALPNAVANLNPNAVVLGTVSLAVCALWPAKADKILSGYVVALIVGTLMTFIGFNDVPIIGKFPTGLPVLQWPVLSLDFLMDAIHPAVILAIIGSVNSLICSNLHDSLTGTRHNSDRELVGQGLSNVANGLLGVLPGSASASGTIINIRAGGRTPVASVLRSIILLALVLGGGKIAEPVPYAVLSGIMIKGGWDIMDWRLLARVRYLRLDFAVPMLATLILTLFADLLVAVGLGYIIAVLARAKEQERTEMHSVLSVPLLDRTLLDEEGVADADPFLARVGLVDLRGSYSVASARGMVWMVKKDIQYHDVVIFNFSHTTDMDLSAALVMEKLLDSAGENNTECIVINPSGSVAQTLNSLDVFRCLPNDRFVTGMDEAKKLALALLRKRDRGTEA